MSVMLDDAKVRKASRAIDQLIDEIPAERVRAHVLGESDETIRALSDLRQALKATADRSRESGRRSNGNGGRRASQDGRTSIAIGRHAFDYLCQHVADPTKKALGEAVQRKTLVGVSFTDDSQVKDCIAVLRRGSTESGDKLESERLEKAARRLESLIS